MWQNLTEGILEEFVGASRLGRATLRDIFGEDVCYRVIRRRGRGGPRARTPEAEVARVKRRRAVGRQAEKRWVAKVKADPAKREAFLARRRAQGNRYRQRKLSLTSGSGTVS